MQRLTVTSTLSSLRNENFLEEDFLAAMKGTR